MSACCLCGNTYANTFSVVMQDKSYDFDCFECAIARLAPICGHCGCRIIGHGIEDQLNVYCCNHCAKHADVLLKKKDV